jgi:hypothetical protein
MNDKSVKIYPLDRLRDELRQITRLDRLRDELRQITMQLDISILCCLAPTHSQRLDKQMRKRRQVEFISQLREALNEHRCR